MRRNQREIRVASVWLASMALVAPAAAVAGLQAQGLQAQGLQAQGLQAQGLQGCRGCKHRGCKRKARSCRDYKRRACRRRGCRRRRRWSRGWRCWAPTSWPPIWSGSRSARSRCAAPAPPARCKRSTWSPVPDRPARRAATSWWGAARPSATTPPRTSSTRRGTRPRIWISTSPTSVPIRCPTCSIAATIRSTTTSPFTRSSSSTSGAGSGRRCARSTPPPAAPRRWRSSRIRRSRIASCLRARRTAWRRSARAGGDSVPGATITRSSSTTPAASGSSRRSR